MVLLLIFFTIDPDIKSYNNLKIVSHFSKITLTNYIFFVYLKVAFNLQPVPAGWKYTIIMDVTKYGSLVSQSNVKI